MKIRKECRKIVIDREIYQYKIGRSHIKIYDPTGKKYDTNLSEVTGMSWYDIEKILRKGSSGICGPSTIEKWIRNNIKL